MSKPMDPLMRILPVMTYRIRTADDAVFGVRARGHLQAALRAARRLYGRRVTNANRATGNPGMSGLFAGYYYDKRLNAENMIGSAFHVQEVSQ